MIPFHYRTKTVFFRKERSASLFGVNSVRQLMHSRKDAQLSQRDRAAGCVIVLAKSGKLELGDNILPTLWVYL